MSQTVTKQNPNLFQGEIGSTQPYRFEHPVWPQNQYSIVGFLSTLYNQERRVNEICLTRCLRRCKYQVCKSRDEAVNMIVDELFWNKKEYDIELRRIKWNKIRLQN